MRTEKLKPNTEYATENGSLVVTGDKPIERGWYSYRENNGGVEKISKGLPGDAPAEDPWSNGSTLRRHGRVGGLRDVREGVRVTWFQVNKDGTKTGEGIDHVVDPKHIKGTWADYVKLHADKIASDHIKREAEQALDAERARLRKRAKEAGLPDGAVGASLMYMVKDREGATEKPYPGGKVVLGYRTVPSLRLEGELVEQVMFSLMSDGH